MASAKKFESIPPFPEDLPTIEIPAVPLGGLLSGDPAVATNIFNACKDIGFFLVDLSNDETGQKITSEVDQIFDLAKDTMTSSEQVKKDYHAVPGQGIVG